MGLVWGAFSNISKIKQLKTYREQLVFPVKIRKTIVFLDLFYYIFSETNQ